MKNFFASALGFLAGCALGGLLLLLLVFLASCRKKELEYDPRQEPDQTGGMIVFEQVFIYPHETN